jgi:hypothetical protein
MYINIQIFKEMEEYHIVYRKHSFIFPQCKKKTKKTQQDNVVMTALYFKLSSKKQLSSPK